MHRCSASTSCPVPTEPAAIITSDTTARRCCNAHCGTCNRCFRSTQGHNRHRCSTHCHRPTARERDKFPHMCICSRRFRLVSDLGRHRVACSFSLSLCCPSWAHVTLVVVALQDRTECVCVCARVCLCVCVCHFIF